MGTRVTALQALPSEDELITMSFEAQLLRKRQSDQTTNTLPAPSMLAEGRSGFRISSRCVEVAIDARNNLARGPACAAIRGTENVDATALKRHDHRAIWLHQRATA